MKPDIPCDPFEQLRTKGPYKIENTASIGWWVNGCCGYLVSGYCKSRDEAVSKALFEIDSAEKSDRRPPWLFTM